jgi:thiol-disulfide isomerase/thioredoxin
VLAPRWFEPLPDLHVRLLDGTDLPLLSARGKVLLLDFWASWCGPCLEELPHLNEIFRTEEGNGLMPVAVNAEEPVQIAREAAATLGIRVPVALYNADIDRQFAVRKLPTVILVDRQSRVRARYDGYFPGMEKAVASTVRQLLSDDPAGAPRKVGESIVGGGTLEIAWSRDFGSSLGGVAAVSMRGGKAAVAVTAEGQLILLDAVGAIDRRFDAPPSAGRLVGADVDGDGREELLAFRTAGTQVAIFDLAQGKYRTVPARSPVLGVAVLPSVAGGGEGKLVLATADGPQLSDARGIEVTPLEGPSPSSAVEVVGRGGVVEIVVVGPDGDLRFLDASGKTRRRAEAPLDSFRLAASGPAEGVGVAPPGAVAAASGRFLAGKGRQAAYATSGQLVLLDVGDGAVRARLRWPGITDLAARDLDGDGADELLVAWDKSLAVLRAARPATAR